MSVYGAYIEEKFFKVSSYYEAAAKYIDTYYISKAKSKFTTNDKAMKLLDKAKKDLYKGFKRKLSNDEYDKLIKVIENTRNEINKKHGIGVKSSNNSNLDQKPKKDLIPIESKNIVPLIEKTLKKIASRYNSDPDLQKKMRDIIVKYDSNADECKEYTNSSKKIKLTCNIFEEYNNEVYFEIIQDDEIIRLALSDILWDIGKELEKELEDYNFTCSCDYGDGDEGCIYVRYHE